jgi:hypothetical protein
MLASFRVHPELLAARVPTSRLAATLAAKRLDTSRHQPTPSERRPRSQAQIDTNRHAEAIYGSEGWGFEFLRAR